MAKRRKNKYRVLDHLPPGAVSVSEYATERDCNTSYIYKLWKEGRSGKAIDFEIVICNGYNFVLQGN